MVGKGERLTAVVNLPAKLDPAPRARNRVQVQIHLGLSVLVISCMLAHYSYLLGHFSGTEPTYPNLFTINKD